MSPLRPEAELLRRGVRVTQIAILVNACLAVAKFVAGILGNTYALVADAVESMGDILASTIVWGGLQIAAREPDDEYPFGYGKAEQLAAAIVALFLLGAALTIAINAVDEIRTPHQSPAPWTLAVLVAVVLVKWALSRWTHKVGTAIGSASVQADAWHHLGDAVTSAAAFIGISIALWGGPGWESADDWAALFAAMIIALNGVRMLRPAVRDLMDRMPEPEVVARIRRAAEAVSGVLDTEKVWVRRTGLGYRVTLHVQSDPAMPLSEAHILSGRVKGAIRAAVPTVQSVLVHMEPFEPPDTSHPG